MNNNFLTKFSPAIGGLLLFLFIVISLWLIFEYAEKERDRDLINWQSRLHLLAEIRAASVEAWLEGKQSQLGELANNTSLRLFVSEYNNSASINKTTLSGIQGHAKNLLKISAVQFGFITSADASSETKEYGLAILDANQQLVMSTESYPKNLIFYKDVIEQVFETAKPKIINIYEGDEGKPVLGYIHPIFQIQDMQEEQPVGAVMLLLDPREDLYKLLKNKQSMTESDESLLVKREGPSLIYLSPMKNGYKLFQRRPDNNNKLASSYAFHHPGEFTEIKDYQEKNVLVTGVKIKNTSWGLVQKISAEEALEESNKHQSFLLTTFILFILIVATAFIAIWKHSTSIRLRRISIELESRTKLLDAVTSNIKDNIILLDEKLKIVFINDSFLGALSLRVDEAKDNHISNVLGKETSDLLIRNVGLGEGSCVVSLLINGSERIYHVSSTKLISGEHQRGVLYVLHDISEIKAEQEKREKLSKGIISTLVKAVDMHDPFCANHSSRTREVAVEIAIELKLSNEQQESLEMASLLANIGKLFVPKEILTKMDVLTDDEAKQLKKHIEYAVDILSELSFNGPVLKIISQKNERLDGSGYPNGLTSDNIMLESRILAVANAFVAMASSRAYREGRSVKEAIEILLQQSEGQYDPNVVAALFHISENKADWRTWQSI